MGRSQQAQRLERMALGSHHELRFRLMSNCCASLAHDASHILDQLRWHSGKPNVESANDA